jgi:hypothetical protein
MRPCECVFVWAIFLVTAKMGHWQWNKYVRREQIMYRIAFILALLLTLLCGRGAEAQQGSLKTINPDRPWDDLLGKRVVAEGLAWGAFAKGLGEHVILEDAKVYVRKIDYLKHDLDGRLVRVTGVLRRQRMTKAPPGAQGYSDGFDYYVIEADGAEVIDQVNELRVKEAPRN